MMNVTCRFSPIRQITFILDLAEVHMPERFSRAKRFYLGHSHRTTLSCSHAVISISRSTRNDLLKLFPEFDSKIKVIPLGFKKAGDAVSNTDTTSILTKHALKDYFLFVSTLEPGKNLPRLVRAFKHFSENHPDWTLVLAGARGWGCNDVFRLIADLGLGQRVKYVGYVTEHELHELYRNCRGFVFPSLYEGFGLTLLEAMQYFVPVLTSNCSSLPEVGGDGAVYCNPNDPEDIYKGMLQLLDIDKSKLVSAYKKQLEYYTWDNSALAVKKILEETLERGKS
ncbi:MAG: glycosyltransferase family 1 protein [Fibrobacterota bacterium]